jgi:hypothetical protein
MIIPKRNGTRRQVGPSPRSTVLPMTVTVLVLLGLTLWFTSFKKLRVTITKPADTNPPYMIPKGEPMEVEGIVDDGGNIYQQLEIVQIEWYSKDAQATGGEVVHWQADVQVDQNTKRFRQRSWGQTITHNDKVYMRAWSARDRAGRFFGRGRANRPLASNVVRVRVE